ncbi:molybdenum cofactor guanylyltransferase [Natronobacterium texcoconense]|uniref:Probable molybdenum cofactor guanylyltransferase n=1 Tax=Natronobacterium texcoconense TaxID=1095778 RepID=A0A1H1C9E1_NATTX|nr:molybdenum cofactor guanylyltransferase [Natronobacterium texcoconense]SDQ60700.1 molybdenum cofactor guanylyltransferase [Natronobacterium texcoconense]
MTTRALSGVIIAGGHSTRFGDGDKALADLAGTPMIRRVVDRLATVTDEVVVNCRDEQREAIDAALEGCEPDVRFAIDPVEDRGPLAGIRTGLEAASREYAAVVACDMPFLDPALLELLADRVQGHDAALVRLEDGWYQTTQAVYRTETMAQAAETTLEGDDARIVVALEDLNSVIVDERDLEGVDDATFESIDTREALKEATARLE